MQTKQEGSAGTKRRRTPSQDLSAALVDAAEAVLVREGPAAVTVRAVATEAGVAPMGVYNRFGSKDGLIEALLVRGYDGLAEATRAAGVHRPLDRLRSSGIGYRDFALSHPQHYALMFMGVVPVVEYSEELRVHSQAALQVLRSHVTDAMASGDLQDGDPADVAQIIWSAVHGAVALELLKCLVDDPAALYEGLVDAVLLGLAPTRP